MLRTVYTYYKKTLCYLLATFVALIGMVHIETSLTPTTHNTVEKRSSVFLFAFLLDNESDSPSEDDSDCYNEQKIEFLPLFYQSTCCCFAVATLFPPQTNCNYRSNFAIELQNPPPEQA